MKEVTEEELREIQLGILKDIDSFCKERKIQYFLYAGSLIGAIRHKGFIPWDDDIDICMKRKDYEFFFKHFDSAGFSYRKSICLENNKEYYLAAGKVVDTRTVVIEAVENPCELGVFVDIFPMDNIPADFDQLVKLNRKISPYRIMLMLKNNRVLPSRVWYRNAVYRLAHLLLKPVKRGYLLNKISSIAQTYVDDDTCNKLADISVFTYGFKEVHYKNEFEETVEMPFEGSMFSVPAGYDSILKRMYGDYMKLPPAEKQVTHHVNSVFWKE